MGCDSAENAWPRIEREGILRVGLDPSYPPFENLVDDQLIGIDIDLMRAIGAELDLDVHFDIIGYDGLYDALLTGRVDVLASALLIDETRTRDFAYSDPYFNAGQLLVTPPQSPISNPQSLTTQTVAVELGAEGHVVATQFQQQSPNLTIATYGTANDALQAVLAGEADAAISDSISIYLRLPSQPDLRVLIDEPLTVDPYALVVRAEDGGLLRKLNEALEVVEVDLILGAWFSAES